MTTISAYQKETSQSTTFLGIILGMFGISIMQLVLATAMPVIVTQIGGDHLYSWVFSGYMLASLLTIPVFSKMADLYGKKFFYLSGMSIFAAGTLLGGFALTMEHLILARVIQGLGSGIMIPVSVAMVSDLFPPERRGRMIGAFSAIQLLANLVSPLLGSLIARRLGWHWIFYMTFIMVVMAIALIARQKQASQSARQMRVSEIDIIGGLAFGVFCVLAVNFSDLVSKTGSLGGAAVLWLVGAVISAALLVWNERRHKDPVIKILFFKEVVLRRAVISALVAGAIMYGLVTLLPLCNTIFGESESLVLMVFMVGMTLGMLASSRLTGKAGSSLPKLLWVLSLVSAGLVYYSVYIEIFFLFNLMTGLLGVFLGGIMATLLISSQNAVSSEDRTVLSGLVQLARYLGAAVGVTILTGILPEISQISRPEQFLGSFGLLIGIFFAGLLNEIL